MKWLILIIILLLILGYFYLKQDQSVASSKIPVFWIQKTINPLQTIRIITPEGSKGTDLDASLYSAILNDAEVLFVNRDNPETHPKINEYKDINIYVEEYLGKGTIFPCGKKYLMVNQEMLKLSNLEHIDVFICKSKYSANLVQTYINENRLKGRVLETKHSSEDVDNKEEKDYGVFVHFAGKSWLKNTESVIQAWIDAKGFPELNKPLLLVTCRGMCYYFNLNMIYLLTTQFIKTTIDSVPVYVHHLYNNIRIYENMPLDLYDYYRKRAGFYICPSYVEGYGHYINEGRSAGAVVITIDAPPMNELSHLATIPYVKKERFGKLPGSFAFYISSDDVIDIVRKVKGLDKDTLKHMGEQERQRYLDDTRSLEDSLVEEFS